MALHSWSGRPGRLGGIAAVSISAAFLLPATTAHAATKPSAAAVRKNLDQLGRQVDQLDNKYNKAKDQLAAATKEFAAVNHELTADEQQHQYLRTRVAQIAAAAYKDGTMDASGLLAAKDPDTALDQMAAFTQLSANRSQELSAFLASAQRIYREKAQAQTALQAVQANAASLKKQKAAVEKAIAKQKALLPKHTASSGPIGGTYTGPASGSARVAVQYAYAQLNKPYIFGGTGPKGYDCSGLTMMAWRAAGVTIPRVVPDQYNAIRHVAKSDLQAGDLVFFDSLGHEGIYVGGGQFIHAPRTGEVVRLDSISNPYWVSHYVGAGRP